MTKSCKQCNNQFEITEDDLKFYDTVSPVFTEKKYQIPTPTLCPDCREQRRLAWQNIVYLYKRNCDLSGKEIISNFSPNKKFKVYNSEEWWSDRWDPCDYGREFNFSRPFFDQFKELMADIPFLNLSRNPSTDDNADYTNYALNNKNGYLLFHANNNQDCYYGFGVKFCMNTVDALNTFSSELLYDCIDCEKCYHVFFSQDCENCSDSLFLNDCLGCKKCIACKNLQNSEYFIFNKKVTPQEFNGLYKEIITGSYQGIREWRNKVKHFCSQHPYRALHEKQNEDSSGDHIYRCQNVHHSFDVKDTRDAKFCDRVFNGPNYDCYDINQFGMKIEQVYECSIVGINASHILFGMICREQVHDLLYCLYSYLSKNLFGCACMRRNEYCILNKQYSKEEYEKIVPKIIEHMKQTQEWGEFFPASLSPFGYNESIAQEYYPLTKEEALKKGFNWSDYESPPPKVEKILNQEQMKKLPDNIKDIPDDILNWALTCEVTGKPYRIIKQELAFYREHNLPIPRRHPDQRHKDRMALRNPRKLYDRTCMKCERPIQTTYAPDRPEIVYCEECYLKEVY